MIHRTLMLLTLLTLGTGVAAADGAPQAQGTATVTVGNDTATWPVWRCARVVLAHTLPDDDILTDNHIKLIDYGDVIQMVLKLAGKNYLADIPASQDMHNVDYEGSATMLSAGTTTFSLRLECNP